MLVSQMSNDVLVFIGIVLFILMCSFIWCIVRIFNAGVKKSLYVYNIVLVVLCSKLMYAVVENLRQKDDLEGLSQWLSERPAIVFYMFVTVILLFAVVGGVVLHREINNTLSYVSIQEGINHMPDGVCFSTAEGIPVLVNKKMRNISAEAFGKGVLDTRHLRGFIESESGLKNSCFSQRRGAGLFLHTADGNVLDMQKHKLHLDDYTISEYIAYDITEQYVKSKELEKRNKHLAAVNEQIKEYSKNLDIIMREKEILDAKIKIHDDVGRSLIALRHYLAQENGDRESLVELWRFTISVLKRESLPDDNTNDRMGELIKAASAVDVELVFDGEIYAAADHEELIAIAIHECLTNTVKHANGSRLVIKTREDGDNVTVEITNDGYPPKGPIDEKGGLKTLRKRAEMIGTMMEIGYKPCFLLRLIMKKEK